MVLTTEKEEATGWDSMADPLEPLVWLREKSICSGAMMPGFFYMFCSLVIIVLVVTKIIWSLKNWKVTADGSLHISWPNEALKTDWRCCSSKQSGVKWLFKSLSLAAIASRAFFLPLAPVADVILLIYIQKWTVKKLLLYFVSGQKNQYYQDWQCWGNHQKCPLRNFRLVKNERHHPDFSPLARHLADAVLSKIWQFFWQAFHNLCTKNPADCLLTFRHASSPIGIKL